MRAFLLVSLLCFNVFAVAADPPAEAGPPELPPVLLQMIRDDAVHRELALTASQIASVQSALVGIDGPWFRTRILPKAQRQPQVRELTEQLRRSLGEILTDDQLARLNQLELQALGTRMTADDRVAEALEITPQTRRQLNEVYARTDRTAAETQTRLAAGELDTGQAAAAMQNAKADETKALGEALSNDQKRRLAGLTGAGFDFQQITRTTPRAPELISENALWLQGGPLQLADLKGKVVAIHFYAFQCINCRRNLPHYNAWFNDYKDQGLVVIGIQTPETAAERSREKVAAAMEAEDIRYPVLMDGQSTNWKAWANTMWPTVYLVDKRGYLRRWWQGELNWKETPGEQQMRQTIEQLLAETD